MNDELAALQAGHLGKELYAFIWTDDPNATREQMRAVLPHHLRFLHDLEARGILFASGPLRDEAGAAAGGLTIVRSDSFENARTIMTNEPFVGAGLRTFRLATWTLNEGRMTVRLDLSQGTFDLP